MPQTTFIDATNPYSVEDPATGAQNGDAFVLTGDNTAAEIFGLNNNLLLMYGDNETLIDSNDTGSSIYALGSNDAITMVNDGPENVVDLGTGTTLDMLNSPNGIVYLYGLQNDPTAELVLPKLGFNGVLFLVGLTMTSADLSAPDSKGVSTLTMLNNGQPVDTAKIAGLGTGTFSLENLNGGVLLSQNPLVHGVTV